MARKESSFIALIHRYLSKRSLSAGVVALLFGVAGVGTCANADSGRPRALIESATFDWGSVSQGVKVSHDFVIKNGGDIDLIL